MIKLLILVFFLFDFVPVWSKTKKVCDNTVDNFLAALKIVPDWFVTNKIPEKFHDYLLAKDDILLFDEDFSKVTFYAN